NNLHIDGRVSFPAVPPLKVVGPFNFEQTPVNRKACTREPAHFFKPLLQILPLSFRGWKLDKLQCKFFVQNIHDLPYVLNSRGLPHPKNLASSRHVAPM